jgi:hypothetical protein
MRISQLAAQKARLMLYEFTTRIPVLDAEEWEPRPEMVCYRGQTLALVRHFFEVSSQVGRVSSLLGREFFRSRVSHHAIPSFEEQAVFVRDVELCLAKLSEDHVEVVTLVGLYDFTHEEVAEMLRCSRSLVRQWFSEAMDVLSEIFLEAGLLREGQPDRRQRQITRDGLPPDLVGSLRKPPGSVRQVSQDEVMPDGGGWAEQTKLA